MNTEWKRKKEILRLTRKIHNAKKKKSRERQLSKQNTRTKSKWQSNEIGTFFLISMLRAETAAHPPSGKRGLLAAIRC